MAKAKKDTQKKSQLMPVDPSVEEHVRQMMDPDTEELKPSAPIVDDSKTAPMVTDLPVPKEPLKIKILHDGDPMDSEPATAPELSAGPDTDITPTDDEPIVPGSEEPEEEPSETEPPEITEPKRDTASVKEIEEDEPSEDPETSKAVEDIVRHEGDELLEASDNKLSAVTKPQPKSSSDHKLRAFFADFWKNPLKRRILIGSLFSVILVLGIVPSSRYYVLNTAGVRASASVHVSDESTFQPLKNVDVSVQGVTVKTDANGDAKLENLRLGLAELTIKRRAFAVIERNVTIGWGSNPLGEQKLKPTGAQYAFQITDYLSGKGVVKAEATSDEASAFSDEAGKLLLTTEDPADEFEVTITLEGRRQEVLKIHADDMTEKPVRLVPARKHAYISRREGRYDVYASYIDGKEANLVLKGTGKERDDMVLVPHPTEDLVALVSTRDGKRNEDGYLMSTLTIIDLRTKSEETVQSSERIQLIGWFGERLAYVRVVAGASASSPDRNRLMAYHYKDDTNNELAASNYCNDVMAVGDRVYYAPSAAYQNGVNVSLFSVKPDNTDRKIILNQEVWNMFRTKYDHISLSVPDIWFDYRIGDEAPTKLSAEPTDLKSLVFTNSPNNEKSIWVDNRDGKGVLVVHDTKTGEDKVLRSQSGIKNPVRWLNDNTIVYRVRTDGETADYALSVDGGEPHKITDVTNTDGIDRWYYY